ncbi:dihydrodipicolinate synthase/N-acetylneuraminate lyase [Rhodopseudomonas rhenobacensis]|uniref:Dihydrodipicolinate synthase/N-acetylneuraminate lyase n=1 Tax=Rhodopseudomonas rhenobacensis TaxID=87461 RepID=A0A7W8DZS1_9BRAD|nr:hypothetical protein [Rhodopseudomonas rhenobacensis]MBB5048152.1 dihydrodipicolinate synthase/N-acetylneuraminate lyase [Rhodopseudomonas rhenobacensis]
MPPLYLGAPDRWMRLTAALAEDGTAAGLKYALSLLGLIAPHLRLPMVEPSQAAKAAIARALMAGVDDARDRRFDLD